MGLHSLLAPPEGMVKDEGKWPWGDGGGGCGGRGLRIQGLVLTKDCSTLHVVQEGQLDGTKRAGIIYNPENISENLVLYETTTKSQVAVKWASRKDRNCDLKVAMNWCIEITKCIEILETKFRMYEKFRKRLKSIIYNSIYNRGNLCIKTP